MRKVGIRQFQQNFHKELKDIPFVVTKDGQDYCEVIAPRTNVTTPVTTATYQTPINEDAINPEPQDARKTGKCEFLTNCKWIGSKYRATVTTDEGEKKNEIFLCDIHFKKAIDSDMEVTKI